MGCNQSIECLLEIIAQSVSAGDPWTTYVLPIASIVVTLLLGLAATFLGWATWKVSREATDLSKRNTALAERAERAPYADAVQAYYESRREDIWKNQNSNMPHYTDVAEASAKRIGDPNAEALLKWVTDSIDHIFEDSPEHDRGINAFHLRGTVPAVISDWVYDPAGFNPAPFKLWHEKYAGSTAPTPTSA